MKYIIYLIFCLLLWNNVFSTSNITTTSGIYIEYQEITSINYQKHISQVNYTGNSWILPVFSNSSQVSYNFNFNLSNYSKTSQVKIFETTIGNTLCSSSLDSNELKSCSINYNSAYLTSEHNLNFQICNLDNVCSNPYLNTINFMRKDSSVNILSGVYIFVMTKFNITTVYPITYVTPTPESSSKKYNINNITIKIYDGNYNFDSCKVNINSQNYTMNYSAHYCTYTYSFNSSNITQSITFQGYYNLSSIETGLEQRTITIYPIKSNNNPMPAYGLASLLITFSLLIGNFIYGGIKK